METTFSKSDIPGKEYIAFFDLDRTLISSNSGKIIVRHAYNRGLMTRMDLLRGFFYSILYRLDLRDAAKIINSMVRWVKGVSEDMMDDLTTEIFTDYLLPDIHNEAGPEICFHKKNGARVVILSSSISPVCKKVAVYLCMDDFVCSNLEVIDGIYTGRAAGPLCFGAEKVTRLKEYCIKNNIDPSRVWYYGDSISDLAVLSFVGNPVCVNPDKKLKKAALQRDWKILSWN